MTSPRGGIIDLRPEAEAAWDEIRAGFSLHGGFWLAFVFGAERREVAEFAARTRDIARAKVEPVDLVVVETVRAALATLIAPRDPLYATWIDATGRRADLVALLQRLNERRDVVRRERPAPFILCCPEGTNGLVRDTAPDLWSIRTLAVIVERPSRHVAEHAPLDLGREWSKPVDGPPVSPSADLDPLIRRTATAVGARRAVAALASARKSVNVALTPEDAALAHAWLAQALMLVDEDAEARRHARLALQVGVPLGRQLSLVLLGLLVESSDPDVQHQAANARVGLLRAALAEYPESPEATRDLSNALSELADLNSEQGRLDTALASASESVDLSRRLRSELGDTPQTLRDLTNALNRLADLQRDRGQVDEALAIASESVDLSRRLRSELGDTPQTLRDLTYALNRLTDLQRDRGQVDEALAIASESVDLSRRLRSQLGDTPQTLRDLSLALDQLGRIQSSVQVVARESFVEALELDRTIRGRLGETAVSLSNHSWSASRVAQIEEADGNLKAALALYQEALEARDAFCDRFGSTSQDPGQRNLLDAIERIRGERSG